MKLLRKTGLFVINQSQSHVSGLEGELMNRRNYTIQDKVTITVCGMGFLFGLVFGIAASRGGNTVLAFIDLSASLVFVASGFWVLKRPGKKAPRGMVVLFACALFFYLFVSGGSYSTGYTWGLLIPLSGFFFLGMKHGVCVAAGYLVLSSVWFLFGGRVYPSIEVLSGNVFARFMALYVTTGVVSFIYERSRLDNEARAMNEIRARRDAEVELTNLKRAVEQSSTAIVITDLKGNVDYANPQFAETTGYSVEEVMGQNIGVLKSGKTKPETYRELWETITAGREWHGEFYNRRKDGRLYWEAVSISPIRDTNGSIAQFLAVRDDVTWRKETEQKTEALYRETSRMNRLMIGREDRIIELKREVNKLSLRLDQGTVYSSVEKGK